MKRSCTQVCIFILFVYVVVVKCDIISASAISRYGVTFAWHVWDPSIVINASDDAARRIDKEERARRPSCLRIVSRIVTRGIVLRAG